jgi:rod shape-determining protein MreC
MLQLLNLIVKFKDYAALSLLCIISLSLISMGDVSKIGGYRAFVVGTIGWLEEAFAWVPNPDALKTENRAVRELNLYLSSELMKSRQALTENKKLREMLDFKQGIDYNLISAEVIGKSTIELREYITINKGKKDGITRGMSVRTDAGLAGIVVVVEDNYTLVETLNNRQVKISAKIDRTGIDGILVWGGAKDFNMLNIPRSFDVKVGDELITSNYSRKYPPGLPIGKIVKVEEDKSSLFHKIYVEPFVSFNTLEQVFVIQYLSDPERLKLIQRMEERLRLLKK